MRPVYIATAYLGPIQQYCKMLQYPEVRIETAENYVKQTYRNRCVIAAANGPLSLSIPIVKPDTLKCQTKDIRISDHGNWRHLHWSALVSAYNMSPFFEYYADDLAPFYEKNTSSSSTSTRNCAVWSVTCWICNPQSSTPSIMNRR